MWVMVRTINSSNTTPGKMATTPAMVINDSATQTVSQSAMRSQITAAMIEEELQNAVWVKAKLFRHSSILFVWGRLF